MTRVLLSFSGLLSLVLGMLLMVVPAAADEPPAPATRTLVNQRVELLPQGRVCWTVNINVGQPGGGNPLEGAHEHGLNLNYQAQGTQRLEYSGGPSVIIQQGEGFFIGNGNWHVHYNIGTTPSSIIIFALTCGAPIPQPAGVRQIRVQSPPLTGIRQGPVPYMATLLEVTGAPGAQSRPQSTAGPLGSYFLEGTVAVSTPAGVTQYQAGDLLVIPPGTPFQTATVGNATARALVALLTPVGEAPQIPRPDVRLPSPGPVALPRAGDGFSWAGPLAMLVAALLLAVGIGLRRARVLPIPRP